MITKSQRNKKIVKLLRSVWSSLDSHLDWVDFVPEGKNGCKRCESMGSDRFQRQVVRDYGEDIKNLTDLLS